MEYSLNLTIEQKLIMTQQMQLSVRLLQMPTFELQQYVDKELLENPVLEIDAEVDKNEQFGNKIDYKDLIKYLDSGSDESRYYQQDDDEVSPLNFVSNTKSLKEFLKEQILENDIDSFYKSICFYIIENIDSRGYLGCDLNDICKELNIQLDASEKALKIVQSLEPIGIGARDLKECLKIQLDKKEITDGNVYYIIDNFLEYVGEHRFSVISKELKISLEEVQEICDLIKSLEPKPARGFYTGESIEYIVPDAFITKINDEYVIIMNEEAAPRLRINSLYKDIIMHENDKKTVNYVKDKINSALFLINSIDKRKSTIYRILEKIIEVQRDYFEYGENYLKPMTLKNVADYLGVHESTVSRAINEKYISTSLGIIKLKTLFTKGLATEDVSDVSTNTIKNVICEMIEKEDKKHPLSDQKISELLNQEGTNIARRTVAKYREELGILPSSKRKRF